MITEIEAAIGQLVTHVEERYGAAAVADFKALAGTVRDQIVRLVGGDIAPVEQIVKDDVAEVKSDAAADVAEVEQDVADLTAPPQV